MAALEKELNQDRSFKILSVSVLTSYSQELLPTNWQNIPIAKHVELLAEESFAAGLTGLVCSAFEVDFLRQKFPQGFFVTPGIRLEANVAGDDQKRVATPAEALKWGASALVVGRPIVDADDPAAAAKSFADSLN